MSRYNNVEFFEAEYWEYDGEVYLDKGELSEKIDPDADPDDTDIEHGTAWFWWYCFPGCLPDSEPWGPYGDEKEARYEWANSETDWDDEKIEEFTLEAEQDFSPPARIL